MNETAALIDACRTLGGCYLQPTRELAMELENLELRLAPLGPDVAEKAADLGAQWASATLEDMQKDFARLFLGPFGTKAPPWGSVYLDDGNMMGGSTLEVKGIYREAGLDMADDFQNPPDHITAELEFLAYLAANQSEVRQAGDLVGAQRLGQLAQRFMAGHIGAWIEPFTSRIKAGAATGFYQTLGRLTPKVVLCAGTRLVPPDAGTTSG